MDYGKNCPHGLPPGGCLNCRAQSEASQAAYNRFAPGKPLKMPAAPKLSQEQVIAELRTEFKARNLGAFTFDKLSRVAALIDQLPKPDFVAECIRVGWKAVGEPDTGITEAQRRCFVAAIAHYRSIGCPEIPE